MMGWSFVVMVGNSMVAGRSACIYEHNVTRRAIVRVECSNCTTSRNHDGMTFESVEKAYEWVDSLRDGDDVTGGALAHRTITALEKHYD